MTPSNTLEEAEKALVAFRARGLALIAQPADHDAVLRFIGELAEEASVLEQLCLRAGYICTELAEIVRSVARSRELPF